MSRKRRQSVAVRAAVNSSIRALNRRRKGERHPVDEQHLALAIANYSGPVTRLPPGAPLGWVPQWLKNL